MNIDFTKPNTKVHMVGIGGVSMAPLAQVLHNKGVIITGSDGQEGPATRELQSLGIPVTIGHSKENIGEADCIIRTAAARESNPEIQAAREQNIPVYERAQGWGELMKGYKNALCLSGTHGKTSTTAMSAQIFLEAQQDPTLMLGGILPSIQKGHHMGEGNTIILESCEYCNSFHHFNPTIAVILNVEEDHLDYFKNLEEIKASFTKFAEKVPEDGLILVCNQDENALDCVKHLKHQSFGITTGDIHTENLRYEHGLPRFTLIYKEKPMGEIALQVPGTHNVLNALAAIGAALFVGLPMTAITKGIEKFTGANRRYQYKGNYQGATIVDDYAHHPTELKALLQAAKQQNHKRILCTFQPHTYTRTKAFLDEFAQILQEADVVLLMDIYAAREPDTGEISSQILADKIPQALYTGNHQNTLKQLQELAQGEDLILTVGAGDVFQVGEALVKLNKSS